MDFETEKILLNQIISTKKDVFYIEDNVIIPDVKPDILSAIDSSGSIYVYKKECSNGKLKIDGGIYASIMYLADNEQNSMRGVQTVIDFSKTLDIDQNNQVKEDCICSCILNVKNIECKILNGRKINVKIGIEVDIKVSLNSEKSIVKKINNNNNIQVMSDKIKISSLKGRGETVVIAKDTMRLDNSIIDILNLDISIKNKELKTSYNKILSKGDAEVSILYLSDDNKIIKGNTLIPIMGFIDMPNVSDEDICNLNYEIRNINIKPDNIDTHCVLVEIEFFIQCESYENKTIDLIQDLYDPEQEILMNQENMCLIQNKLFSKNTVKIQEKISVSDISSGKILSIKAIPRILKENISNNAINYEGEVNFKILYESKITKKPELKEEQVSFVNTFNNDSILKESIINTTIDVDSEEFNCINDDSIDVSANLIFNIDSFIRKNSNIVKGLEIQKLEDRQYTSLVVYFVKPGDSLWSIAKKFRSTVDEIAKINNIEDKNKIAVGTQLFIPRYVCNACNLG